MKDVYNSEIEKYVVELLYRIKLAKEYFSACEIYRNLRNGDYIDRLKMANDFFVTAFEAINTALMLEISKLSDEQHDSCSVVKFFRRCDSDKMFSEVIVDNNSFDNIVHSFFDFYRNEKTSKCIKNIEMRRDKYYGHYDKKYFTDIDSLLKDSTVFYEDILYLLDNFETHCLMIYKTIKGYDWKPCLHQGTLTHTRDCSDLIDLLDMVIVR